jgi:Zn-dependent protease
MRLSLGKIFGIKVDIHWTFSFIIIWIIYSNLRAGLTTLQIFWSLVFISSLFLCVVLHEFGHALAARRYGIETKDITLYPIGGVARLEKMPENPLAELVVAIAGPMVNVVIMIALLPFIMNYNINQDSQTSALVVDQTNFLAKMGIINIWLAVFNLIPAFPMDGGRVLRALLTFKMGRVKATSIAATIGKGLALIFILTGFYLNPFLIFIGVFIILGAHSEAQMVQRTSYIENLTLRNALMTNYQTLDKNMPISESVRLLIAGEAKNFVITENGLPFGVLNRDNIIYGISRFEQSYPIGEIADRNVILRDINTPLQDVFIEFHKADTSIILVTELKEFVGIIDLENINELMMIIAAQEKKS